jgi:beta-glucosidase
VDDLTLAEKAALCQGADFWHTVGLEEHGVERVTLSDGPHGLRNKSEQHDPIAVDGSPPATCFPTASALGSSWNPDLLEQVGVALGRESRAAGVGVLLGPGVNIKRSPLCGRNFEYFSEDPLLSGVLGAAWVNGLQSQGVGAAVKHFAVNNQETDRLRVSAEVDERALREIYLPAFERIVHTAQPWTVMCAYNRINGTFASQNHWLLTEVLRQEWGFDGLVMSDWGATRHRTRALAAGLDLEMPPDPRSHEAILTAIAEGALHEDVLDQAADRVLALSARVSAGKRTSYEVPDLDSHHALARRAAAECAVLLRNDEDLLPLNPDAELHVAVIGAFADEVRFQGAGSSQVTPTRVDNPLDELRRVASAAKIAYAPGFRLDGTPDEQLAIEAVGLAQRADVVVALLGLPQAEESEGFDRTHLDLPPVQTELLAKLAAVNPRVIVVLANGAPVRLATWEQHAAAVLELWLAGQAAGGALADLLFGVTSPSGRLAETLPVDLADCPASLTFPGDSGRSSYGEGIFVGYRGYDRLNRPVSYPFGHGLTYTTFDYRDLTVNVSGGDGSHPLRATVTATVVNTGQRAASEVVQLYVSPCAPTVARPVRELKGFVKLHLHPGEQATAVFELDARDLSYWSTTEHAWVLDRSQVVFEVGASSRDLRLTATHHIKVPTRRPELSDESTLAEWLADPTGGPQVLALAAAASPTASPAVVGDEQLLRVIGDFPLRVLATFPDSGFDHDSVDKLVARHQRRGRREAGEHATEHPLHLAER